MKIIYFVLATFLISVSQPGKNGDQLMDPLGLVLTWQQDPTSTMTIDWHTVSEDRNSGIRYRVIGTDEWFTETGENFPYPHSDRIIHRVELTGLEADTGYEFRTGDYTRTRKFRTMPAEAHRPVRFAAGGDVRHRVEWMDRMNRQVSRFSPEFIVWGGDLAYADGRDDVMERWYEFMDSIMHTLVTPDGFTIPVLAGIGNHEVRGGRYYNDDHERRQGIPAYEQNDKSREQIAPNYYKLFAFPGQPGYGVLDFGNYLSIILLDTDHTNPIEGEQTEWLEKVLSERTDVPNVIPNYHVPGFPSVRRFDGAANNRVRENWVPLFEEYGVKLVFENHDHAYKRTYPIRDNAVSANGVVYMGDGTWGVGARIPGNGHEEHAWYMKRAASVRHAIIVTVHGGLYHTLVVNEDGGLIDEYPRTPHFDLLLKDLARTWEKPVIEHIEDEHVEQ
jgi:acid phosphatase type 7